MVPLPYNGEVTSLILVSIWWFSAGVLVSSHSPKTCRSITAPVGLPAAPPAILRFCASIDVDVQKCTASFQKSHMHVIDYSDPWQKRQPKVPRVPEWVSVKIGIWC